MEQPGTHSGLPSFRLEGGPLTVQSMQTIGQHLRVRPGAKLSA